MKRFLVCMAVLALAAGVLAAPAAAAKTRQFQGTVSGGGTVTFTVTFKHGKPKQAGLFSFRNIPVTCDSGPSMKNYFTRNSVPVRHRKFHYDFNFAGGASIDGKLNKKGNRASGSTSYGPTPGNCTTNGSRSWTASIVLVASTTTSTSITTTTTTSTSITTITMTTTTGPSTTTTLMGSPVCCTNPSMGECIYASSASECASINGTPGAAGTVCDCMTGHCVPPPVGAGNCCDGFIGGGCVCGPEVNSTDCASAGGTFGSNLVCSPSGACGP